MLLVRTLVIVLVDYLAPQKEGCLEGTLAMKMEMLLETALAIVLVDYLASQ